jgi:hypothetical protein
MPSCRARLFALLLLAPGLVPAARATDPTDNPVATYYAGPEGYPAWTDAVRWSNVVNMKTYPKGKTAFEKFERARDELAQRGGGVLYYPAGTYDFSTMPVEGPLLLRKGIVIRGEAPAGHPRAAGGKLELPTKFIFAFRDRGGGKVPRDWNFLALMTGEAGPPLKDVDLVGIAWVHLVGATIAFDPQMDWGKTWDTSRGMLSDKVKRIWAPHPAIGTHPIDPLIGAGKQYQGAGKGRLVFGCVLDDSAVLDDFLDPGYGGGGFHTQRYCARVVVYGSRVLVANNLLPRSRKNFKYAQKVSPTAQGRVILFDYGKTLGIDVNKELLAWAHDEGRCPGYFEEGVVVRDNFVYNHGHKGYNVAGTWVTIVGNTNQRDFLRQGDNVHGLGLSPWTLTVDGWEVAGPGTDNLSRAFDLAGRNLWVDGNRFDNTGSAPGSDGEGIVCRPADGTPIYSWALTHNTHTRGIGSPGLLGTVDGD